MKSRPIIFVYDVGAVAADHGSRPNVRNRRLHGGLDELGNLGCDIYGRPLEYQRVEGPLMPPTLTNGKICYIEMPATDVVRSSDFYQKVFGWNIRKRGDGSTSFDDTTGQVSGTWVLGRPPGAKPGLLFYVMVDSVAATLDAIVANGGEIVHAHRRGRARDHCEVPRSSRKRDWPLSTAGLIPMIRSPSFPVTM